MLKGSHFTLLKYIFPYLHTHISFYSLLFSYIILYIGCNCVSVRGQISTRVETFFHQGVDIFPPLPKVLYFEILVQKYCSSVREQLNSYDSLQKALLRQGSIIFLTFVLFQYIIRLTKGNKKKSQDQHSRLRYRSKSHSLSKQYYYLNNSQIIVSLNFYFVKMYLVYLQHFYSTFIIYLGCFGSVFDIDIF